MTELTDRQRTVLAFVVQDFIDSAQPVGSETLTHKNLGVSSATIRNELAHLEDEGFLTHPHTSAGRIPTAKGYRYFVESLMDKMDLPDAEQRMISHQFHQVTLDVDQWMRLAAAVVAHSSHTAALVAAPRTRTTRFKHVQLIEINEQVAMLVLVLQEGTVKQQMLTLPQPMSQDELTRLSNLLNDKLSGATADLVRGRARKWSGLEENVAQVIARLIDEFDRRNSRDVYRDGIIDILRQPEFGASERMQSLLALLEQRSMLESVLFDLAPERGVHVVIGREGGVDELSEYSIVLARYGVEGQASGVISVLGPMRMPYGRAVGVVKYVSNLLDELMMRFYSR
ncbi:MAG TPA: heat-inducible transcriptional repressor HrcA [Anaerolineae bacterium]